MPKVIISGGTGLIGQELCRQLEKKGYEAAILTRKPSKPNEYQWDVGAQTIDERVLDGAVGIIHLAGAAVADKAWTAARKAEIIDSRVNSAALLFDTLKKYPHRITAFLSASAVGWYGDGGDRWQTEDRPAGNDFLGEVCRKWESAADRFGDLGLRVAKLRIGIVLSRAGGALPKMGLPARFGIGGYFGSGQQYMPWIHIEDLAALFIHALENDTMHGPYNACAPEPITQKAMMCAIAKAHGMPCLPVPAPAFVLRTLLGERAGLLLNSNRCSAEKTARTGFRFQYTGIDEALRSIYQNK